MQQWLALLKTSGVAGSSEDALSTLWQNGQIGMFFNVMLGSASMKATAPKLWPNLMTAPPPWPSKKAISRLHPVVVMKSSKNQDASMELVKWFVDPKNLWYVIQNNGYPVAPYSNFASKVPEYSAYEESLPWATGFRETKFVGEYDLLGNYVAHYAQIGNIICNHIENAVSGASTVQQALDAAQQDAQQSLHV
jgi:ABC-type glycerol-3-phosphate transport system substrate-binding protein